MLFWEWDHDLFDVHHLMVLCYHLQHPGLYSPGALGRAKRMLVAFVEEGVTPGAMRTRISREVDAGARESGIRGKSGTRGAYANPVRWEMRAGDVVRAGAENYYASVRRWAESILRSLREVGEVD
jgi:hypothetical protein